jgi:hypothetical protein
LVDTGAAIIVEGRYLGGLGFGQFFLEPPDMAFPSKTKNMLKKHGYF